MTKKYERIKKHNTETEKEFIDGLGTFATEMENEKKADIYEKYVNALRKRKNWDGMDSEKIINYALKKWAKIEHKKLEAENR